MKINFKRLLSVFLAGVMVIGSLTFTVTAGAADYADASTASGAKISEVSHNNPLDYKVGDDIEFFFQITSGSTVYTAPYLSYSAVMDDGRTLTGYVTPVDGKYTVTLEGGLLRPGFVMMTVQACNASKAALSNVSSYTCGAGADVDKIQSIYGIPDEYSQFGDFDAFWDETLSQLDAEGGEATIQYIYKCAPVTKDGVVFDCYELEINCPKDEYYNNTSWCGTNHVQAFLTVPQGAEKGSLKLLLDFKGYDWISASGNHNLIDPQPSICNVGYATLSVSPHSIPAPHNVAEKDAGSSYVSNGAYTSAYYYTNLKSLYGYTSSHGKNATDNASPYTTYFKYMLMRDVQAANFLMLYFSENGIAGSEWAGLWDGKNLKTNGPSQGGYQAISVAGLVPEVNEVSASVPWFGDQGVESKDSDRYTPTNPRGFGYYEALRYVDTANLASRISKDCNVTIKAGLIDTLVPPSTIMSIYDNIDASVTLTFWQNNGHSVGSGPYTQTISKAADTAEKSNSISYKSDFDPTFIADFEAAWAKVCDENVVSVELYTADKATTLDFAALANASTADAVGVVLTGEGLTNINAKLAEIYALHNDVNSKIWVIENNNAFDGKNAAITLDACMNWGDRPTGTASLTLYGAEGVKGQSFVLTANEPYAVIPSPLWVAGQGILVTADNITLNGGLMSSTGEDGSVTFTAPNCSATFESVGVGDAEAYGNIDGVGLWIYNGGKLTIKGAGAMPDYASASDTPWAGKAVTEIELTDGITSIGAYAFAEFTATLNVPKSVNAIDATAIKAGSTIVGYDNAYAKTFASANGLTFTNLGAAGTMGEDVYWHLDLGSGLFTVSGTGSAMYAQDAEGNRLSVSSPWTESNWAAAQYYSYRNSIKKIVIEAPIKNIESYCLTFINNCTTIELPEAYTGANTISFHGMASLTCIYTKGQTPEVGTANLSNLTIIGDYCMVQVPVTKVILNDSVTKIGTQVFYSCSKLAEINLPASLASIGKQAFYNCKALKSITLPAKLTTVSSDAFEGCTGITSLTVKNASLNMGFAAHLTGLTMIVAPEGSTAHTYATQNNIAFEAYEEVIDSGECGTDLYWKLVNKNGMQVLEIYGTGTTVTSGIAAWGATDVAPWADYYSTIQKIVIGESVTKVNNFCFFNMKNALTTVEITENLKTIGQGAFSACAKLSTIYVKGNDPVVGTYDLSNVTSLSGGYQFDSSGKGCVNNIILSDNLTAIGDKTFAYVNSITSLTFPASVTSVSYRSLIQNTKLTSVTFLNKDTIIPSNFLLSADEKIGTSSQTPLKTVYGYEGSTAEAWVKIANQYYADNSIDREITFVPLSAPVATGKAGENLTWKIVEENGENVMYIQGTGTYIQPYDATNGVYGFGGTGYNGWDGAKAHSVFDFYPYAIDSTNKLTKVVIEAPVTKVQGYTFAAFDYVTTLELPTSMTSLQSSSCFNDMDRLVTVYTTGQTPEVGTANLTNVSSFADYSFVKSAFKKIIFKENASIGKYSFMWNTGLETLELPEGVTIGSGAFSLYTSSSQNKLRTISFPESLAAIPYSYFTITDSANGPFKPNTFVTTITINNPEATFEGATTDAPYTAFLNNFTALTTVYGYAGSTAEAMVTWANENTDRTLTFVPFEESDENVVVKDMPIGDDLYFRILLNEDGETYTMEIYGEGSVMTVYKKDGTAFDESARGSYNNFSGNGAWANANYNPYATKVSKIKFSAPNLKTFWGYAFREFGSSVGSLEIELHPNIKSLSSASVFNGAKYVDTLYTTGATPVKGVCDLSNVTSLGSYAFVDQRFTKIIIGEGTTTIPNYCFGTQNGSTTMLEAIVIPSSVTKIEADAFRYSKNLVYIDIKADNLTISSSAFSSASARTTVIGVPGSASETLATSLGLQFIDSAEAPQIDYYYYVDNSVLLLAKVGEKYTAFATGSDTKFELGFYDYPSAVAVQNGSNGSNRPWNSYKSLITKVVYVNPALTYTDATFATHTNVVTIEAPASLTTFGSNAFNNCRFKTFHVTGTEFKEGVADFSNVTDLGYMGIAYCSASTILLNNNYSNDFGDNLFFQYPNLTYIRIPVGVSALTGKTFNGSKKLTTVLFENPDTTIGTSSFVNCSSLKTIIGYKGSTAETYASSNGLTFIPLDAEGALSFEGFQIRETGYNGLRSLYSVSLAELEKREAAGLTVVEFGSVIASADKLANAGAELTVWVDAEGNVATHDFAKKIAVMTGGNFTDAKILASSTESQIDYACTLVNYNASNYNKDATFRGYIVFADKEGNLYIEYADLLDEAGSSVDEAGKSYGTTSLDAVVEKFEKTGELNESNICYIDVKKFREETLN